MNFFLFDFRQCSMLVYLFSSSSGDLFLGFYIFGLFFSFSFGINFILFVGKLMSRKRKGDEIYYKFIQQWTNNTHFGFVADTKPFTWCWWLDEMFEFWISLFCFLFVSVMYQMKNAIQCGLFISIKFNQCDPWYMSTSQCRINLRYLIEIWALHQHTKRSFICSSSYFCAPDRISHEIHKGRNKSPLVIWCWFFLVNFIFSKLLNLSVDAMEKMNLISANCDVNFHSVFHFFCCFYICGTFF